MTFLFLISGTYNYLNIERKNIEIDSDSRENVEYFNFSKLVSPKISLFQKLSVIKEVGNVTEKRNGKQKIFLHCIISY